MAHLRPIDKEFEEADDTGVLVLSSRNLRNFPLVPGELCDFNDLLEADFSNNRFDSIPQELCDFQQLVRLSFYRNSLRELPEDLRLLENLKDLNLSRNRLAIIPEGLCHMHLHSLNLSNNRLVSLPLQLGSLKQLRYLNLSCNSLPDLPNSFVELTSLQHLDLHRNQLRELPSDIQMLALRYLDISCNQITALPNTLRHIEHTLKIFKMTDNPIESPPTHVCVRGFTHIVKWMEALEKHGSDPHLLSGSLSSREASLARRGKNKRQTPASVPRSMMDSSYRENGIANLDEITNLMNASLGEPSMAKNDGEITPTHTSTPMHWSVAQFRNTPGSAMSDQSKEEYREAAHKLYMQQERQKNRNIRRKRSSSPIQSTAKAAVAMVKQQSGSQEFNSLPRRSSKEEMNATQLTSASGGTKSLGGSPRVPSSRSLPGEKNPRPGSWSSHPKVTSSPILPSKYSLPANEKQGGEEEGSSRGGDSEEKKAVPQTTTKAEQPIPQTTTKAEQPVMRRNISSERTRAQPDESYRKPSPLDTTPAIGPTHSPSRDTHQHPASKGVGPQLSPVPRSDSVTPTNELIDEESLTPKSKEAPKDPGQTLAAASLKLQNEVVATKTEVPAKKKQTEVPAKKKQTEAAAKLKQTDVAAKLKQTDVATKQKQTDVATKQKQTDVAAKQKQSEAVATKQKQKEVVATKPAGSVREDGQAKTGRTVEVVDGRAGKKNEVAEKEKWRQSLPEQDMVIETLDTSPKSRRPITSESDAEDRESTWPRSIPPRKKKEKDVFRFLKEHDVNYTVRRQEFQMSRVIEKCRTVKEKIESLLGLELADDIGEWVTDGVVPCQLVRKLHPQLMTAFHTPAEGKELSRGKKTVNIANFIAACRQLQVPEEELCSAGDIIELKDPVRVVTCLQRVLESADIHVTSP